MDTSMGAGQSAFRTTQWGRILEARDESSVKELLEDLAESYWRPVYKFIRIVWKKGNEDAKDLTQDFFATVFRPEFLSKADRTRGTFRTFVLASLKNFLKDYEKYRGAQKRGGGVLVMPIEEELDVPDNASPDDIFLRSWAESVLADSLRELEERVRKPVYAVFHEYCTGKTSYQELAKEHGIKESDVGNRLFEARKQLRRILLRRAGASVSSWSEAEKELRTIFGV